MLLVYLDCIQVAGTQYKQLLTLESEHLDFSKHILTTYVNVAIYLPLSFSFFISTWGFPLKKLFED